MDIKQVRLHTCEKSRATETKIEGYIEGNCRCRKYVSEKEAQDLVDDGDAQFIVTSFIFIPVKYICSICENIDNLKKACSNCGKTGTVIKEELEVYRGEDIYMRPNLKTPRHPTIEQNHILYAYIKQDRDAIKRIELYNDLTQVTLAELGAELINTRTKEVVMKGTPEPEDNPKTQQGRKYDYGRPI